MWTYDLCWLQRTIRAAIRDIFKSLYMSIGDAKANDRSRISSWGFCHWFCIGITIENGDRVRDLRLTVGNGSCSSLDSVLFVKCEKASVCLDIYDNQCCGLRNLRLLGCKRSYLHEHLLVHDLQS